MKPTKYLTSISLIALFATPALALTLEQIARSDNATIDPVQNIKQ